MIVYISRWKAFAVQVYFLPSFLPVSLELPKGYQSCGISIKVFKIQPCEFKLILKIIEKEK